MFDLLTMWLNAVFWIRSWAFPRRRLVLSARQQLHAYFDRFHFPTDKYINDRTDSDGCT